MITRLKMLSIVSLFSLLLSACQLTDTADTHFSIQSVETDIHNQPIKVDIGLTLKFSAEVEEALNKGVTIPLKVIARIVRDNQLSLVVEDRGYRWEIHYLPMSRHYLLTDMQSKEQTTWARLRHALGSLDRIMVELPPVELEPGNYRLEVKVFLDRRRLPAPMRLPALVSSGWKLETNWYQWPFQISN